MPTEMHYQNAKRFMETGVCACGEHFTKHVNNYDDLKKPDAIACKLLATDVAAWNSLPQQQVRA